MNDTILNSVVKDFPDLNDEITDLFKESSSFRELCEDYVLCTTSIHNLSSIEIKAHEKDVIDLKDALNDLKEELLSRISNHD